MTKVLQRPTLILNRNWQPVNVATVARALVLLWNESARVVDPKDFQLYTWEDWAKLRPRDGEDHIQAVRFKLRVPEVVALSEYDRLPVAHVTFSRRNIFKRDHYACQYCGDQPGSEELTIDHVLPRAQDRGPIQECPPGRGSGLQRRPTGFESLHSGFSCRRGSIEKGGGRPRFASVPETAPCWCESSRRPWCVRPDGVADRMGLS